MFLNIIYRFLNRFPRVHIVCLLVWICIYYTEVICFGLSPQCPFIKKSKIKIATAGFGPSFKLRWREAVGGFLRLLLRHVACNIKHALPQILGAEGRFLGFDFLMLLTFYSCIIFPLPIACLTPQTGLVPSALAAMLLHKNLLDKLVYFLLLTF